MAAVEGLPEFEPVAEAPYEQLVTIGEDDHGNLWLLDLESFPVLTVTGDADYAGDFARYVAAELAVNAWSRDVYVSCVGIAKEAVAINPARVSHHASLEVTRNLLAHAVNQVDRCTAARMDVGQVRWGGVRG